LLDGMSETFPMPEYVKAFDLACMQQAQCTNMDIFVPIFKPGVVSVL